MMQKVEARISFDEYYHSMGLAKYPFRDRTAEKEDTLKLFIEPLDYSRLDDDMSSNNSVLICGNRGSGKTMILLKLKDSLNTDKLSCFIDNFEDVSEKNNRLEFYSVILQNLTRSALIFLSNSKKSIKNLTKDDKMLLSFLVMKYGDLIADYQFKNKLEEIQLSPIKKILNKLSAPITAFLNYGSTAVTNFGNELLTKHFGAYLPNINEENIRKVFPDINFQVEDSFKSVEISYSLLDISCQMFCRLAGSLPIVFIDKLDEDIRLENDAELVSGFIKELICDNQLLLNKNIQLIISVWKIPFDRLSTIFRESKHSVYNIRWNTDELKSVLNQRLAVYSSNQIKDVQILLSPEISEETISDIYKLSNSNPRDLWGVFDSILNAQFSIDPDSDTICDLAVRKGLKNFVQHFHFYEYYPRSRKAQKNSNDVYSYINYLLKLQGTDEFTNGELREIANTGGSTTNYITNMMNIGLVKKTDRKRAGPGGAIIYQVNDPKVSYAIFNKIDIQHG